MSILNGPTFWVSATLSGIIGLFWWHGKRLRKLEATQAEISTLKDRIATLEQELEDIKQSVPFQIFRGNGAMKIRH